jgi:hypothetical protein
MTMSARRALALAAATATATAGTLVWAPAAQAKTVTTDYGFSGRAWGTQARASVVGAGSSRSALSYLGCTRLAGLNRSNGAAEVGATEGSMLTASAVKNRNWTYRTRKRVGSRASSHIAEVTLGDPEGPHLVIEGLRTLTNAYAVRRTGRLGARSTFKAADVTANTGVAEFDDLLDGVNDGLGDLSDAIAEQGGGEIPGLGKLNIGGTRNKVRKLGAVSSASAIWGTLYGPDMTLGTGDDVKVVVGKAGSNIHKDLPAGIMRGKAVPVEASLLGGEVKVGRLSDVPLPCPGTRGDIKKRATADVNLLNADVLDVSGLRGRVWGIQRDNGVAKAWTEATVAGASLGDGALEIEGVVGRVNVATNRAGRIVTRNIKGSTIGSLTADGERYALPDPGETLEIPGLAKVRAMVTKKVKRGLSVTALQVTLLDDTAGDSVINLGQARAYIHRS